MSRIYMIHKHMIEVQSVISPDRWGKVCNAEPLCPIHDQKAVGVDAGEGRLLPKQGSRLSHTITRGSAIAEEPRDALRQLKYYGRF